MKNLSIACLIMLGSFSLQGELHPNYLVESARLDESLSPEVLEIKRALDKGTLTMDKADKYYAEVMKKNNDKVQDEFRELMDGYKENIISNAEQAVNLNNPSFRKMQHLRAAVKLLTTISPNDELEKLTRLTTQLGAQVNNHPALVEINQVKTALEKGNLTFKIMQNFLYAPDHNAGYYIDNDVFAKYQPNTFAKARKMLKLSKFTDEQYDNIIAELTLFDLFGATQDDQTVARELKKQLIQKFQ